MSGSKKSVDEIWKELNAAKPKPRQGIAGLAVGLSGLPGITSVVRTKPATAPAASASSPTDPGAIASSTPLHATLAADGPYQASTVGEDAAAYLATLQRTINCLADPDRGLRRNAATALHTKLFTGDTSTPRASPAQLQALLCGPLLRPLVALLSDSVERCRATALSILLDGGRQLSDLAPMLPELVPELARRFGAIPVQEPAEEVRLQISRLVGMLLAAAPPPLLARFIPDLAAVICRSAEDGFPDIKRAACAAVETAAARLPPGALEPEAEKLLTSLAPTLQHQHSRVRLAAIQAIDALVAAGAPIGLVEGTVATALRPVGHDRAQPVREAAFGALARWLGYHGPGSSGGGAAPTDTTAVVTGPADGSAASSSTGTSTGDMAEGKAAPQQQEHQQQQQPAAGRLPGTAYVPSLLPLLIIGVTDPQPSTAELALRLMEGVGEAWASTTATSTTPTIAISSSAGGLDADTPSRDAAAGAVAEAGAPRHAAVEDSVPNSGEANNDVMAARVAACQLGPPYTGRPGPGCRAMVRALLPQHLPPLVRQLGEWTVALRVAAARGLHTSLVLAEGGAAAHLRLLLPALCSAIADEEVEVATLVMACVHVLGAHVAPSDWLPRLLDTLLPPGGSPSQTSSSAGGAAGGGGGGGNGGSERATAGLSISQRIQTLVVLSGLMHAAGHARWELPPPLLTRLAAVLADEAMLAAAADHPAVRQQLLAATVNALAWGGGACTAVALPLHIVLLLLYGSELVAAAAGTASSPVTPQAVGGGGGGGGAQAIATARMVRDAMDTLAVACCGKDTVNVYGDSSVSSSDGVSSSGSGEGTVSMDGAAVLAERHADWLVTALFGCDTAATTTTSSTTTTTAASSDATISAALPLLLLAWRSRAGDAMWQCVLRATLLTSSLATLGRMAPALVGALSPVLGDREREAPLRLALLQLLDGVLEDPLRGPALARAAGQALITDVLMPPLTWQAGKTAAAVRYAAVTALATLLGRRLPHPDHVLAAVEGGPGGSGSPAQGTEETGGAAGASTSSAPPPPPAAIGRRAAAAAAGSSGAGGGLLPLLFSALDEDWYTDMRLAACYVVEQLLELVGPSLSDASRRALYPELHKRLDDAHNAVRVAACGALRAFVAAAGPGYCDTNSGYLVGGVVIHMDDGDTAVQDAACSVLLAAAATKPSVTAREVRKVRDRFRSKHYCDRVLAACEAAVAAAGAGAGTA